MQGKNHINTIITYQFACYLSFKELKTTKDFPILFPQAILFANTVLTHWAIVPQRNLLLSDI